MRPGGRRVRVERQDVQTRRRDGAQVVQLHGRNAVAGREDDVRRRIGSNPKGNDIDRIAGKVVEIFFLIAIREILN